jgi:glyoxylase-like metal-dependent hydrolase (beta-lactamase superfamily II)
MKMDRSLMVANWQLATIDNPAPVGEYITFPVPAFFIDHPSGGILFDGGCHPECMGPNGLWPTYFQHHFPYSGGAEHFVVNRLRQIGKDPSDVRTCVVSHLHNDHTGGLEFFPKARTIVHEDELHACLTAYAKGDRTTAYTWDETDRWTKLGLDFDLIGRDDGDLELAEGVTILNFGSGHSYGMLGLKVDLPKTGPVLIVSDAIYCRENYGPPVRPSGIMHDRIGYLRTIERIRRIADRCGAQVWFGHDPEQFSTLKHNNDYYA